MLRVQDVRVNIRKLAILRGVTLEVPHGAIVALVGRNGAGKTTTLRAVMGLMPISAGAITVNGTDMHRVPPHQRASMGIGYMPEDRRLIPLLTVEQNLLLPAWANRLKAPGDSLERIYRLIPAVKTFAPRRAGQLSGGQQKLAALARSLMVGRRLLLLDEPFEGLAPALVEQLGMVLQALMGEGVAILIAESELTHIGRLAQQYYTIERGEIISSDGQ